MSKVWVRHGAVSVARHLLSAAILPLLQLLARMTTSDEMGTFCHDHIQHPLMWCDDKKRLVERKNAEESLRMWRRRKAEENARKEKDKQEVK